MVTLKPFNKLTRQPKFVRGMHMHTAYVHLFMKQMIFKFNIPGHTSYFCSDVWDGGWVRVVPRPHRAAGHTRPPRQHQLLQQQTQIDLIYRQQGGGRQDYRI